MPKWYSKKLPVYWALGLNSIHSVCAITKLKFLHRVYNKINEENICYQVYSAMVDDVETLSHVRECRELEERYESDFTTDSWRSRISGWCLCPWETCFWEGPNSTSSRSVTIWYHRLLAQDHQGNWVEEVFWSSSRPRPTYCQEYKKI